MAGRVEEIPEVGSFITYDIGDDSIVVVRAAPDTIKAYHNVCPHRGRRLIGTPPGANRACGKKQRFVCGFHGWAFNLDGKNIHILDKQDWKGALTEERTSLSEVKVDTWGGWIFINMDPNCVSLREYLEPAASILDPFEFEKMRYKWRQWVIYPATGRRARSVHGALPRRGHAYAAAQVRRVLRLLQGVRPAWRQRLRRARQELKMSQSSSVTRAGKARTRASRPMSCAREL